MFAVALAALAFVGVPAAFGDTEVSEPESAPNAIEDQQLDAENVLDAWENVWDVCPIRLLRLASQSLCQTQKYTTVKHIAIPSRTRRALYGLRRVIR